MSYQDAMFAIADINNCYVSCERRFNPRLEGKAVVVLSNNDGCVIARSEEAKTLGIKMGDAYFMIQTIIEKYGIIVLSSNYTLYADITGRLMGFLETHTPHSERYSIDEMFLWFKNALYINDMEGYCYLMRCNAYQYTKLPICIGVAPTKALAKAANRYAKKMYRARGVYVIDSEEKRRTVLEWLKVDDIWGIGNRNYDYFHRVLGLQNALQFSQLPEQIVRKKMGVVGARLLYELNGTSCLKLEEIPSSKQNICTSKSFPYDIGDLSQLVQAVATHATRCAEKLRDQKSCAWRIEVFIKTNKFKYGDKQHSVCIPVEFHRPTNNTQEIVSMATYLCEKMFRKGHAYKSCGVIVGELVPDDQVQTSIFDRRDRDKDAKMMKALDAINKQMGQDTVRLGTAGYNGKWQMKREFLTPAYTTKWSDIPKVYL